MDVDVETRITIARPREEVAAYAMDPSNAPEWYANIDTVVWETDPPVVVGSRVAFVARFLGRRLAYTYEVVDLESDRRLVMQTVQGPFPMQTTYAFADAGGDTVVTLRNAGSPAGFKGLAAPVMAAAMRHANAKDLGALKRVLERR
jgi:uncharacterized protein YndB with AHSA1/START domain